eukprot:10165016-Alexandrium_andersonii.AAC.1
MHDLGADDYQKLQQLMAGSNPNRKNTVYWESEFNGGKLTVSDRKDRLPLVVLYHYQAGQKSKPKQVCGIQVPLFLCWSGGDEKAA